MGCCRAFRVLVLDRLELARYVQGDASMGVGRLRIYACMHACAYWVWAVQLQRAGHRDRGSGHGIDGGDGHGFHITSISQDSVSDGT